MRSANLAKFSAAILAAMLLCSQPALADLQTEKAAAEAAAHAAATAIPDDKPLVRINGEEYNYDELRIAYARRPAAQSPVTLPQNASELATEDLERLAKNLGAYDLIAEEATKSGVQLDEQAQEDMRQLIQGLMDRYLYKTHVQDRVGEPTEEQLQELYEKVKDTRLQRMEELRMRHIFVSTYVPYTVEEGDTLESIAREISEDEAKAELILSDATKRPRAEMVEGETAEGSDLTLPPKPLAEGEKLLVPGGPKIEEKAKARIEEALALLKEGKPFLEVAEEYSENEKPGQLWVIRPKTQPKEILPEIKENFFKLEDGGHSEPLRTKHGFQIVRREGYQEEGHVPFEDAREFLKSMYVQENTRKHIEEFFDHLISRESNWKIDMDNVTKAESERSPDDVLVVLGDRKLTREELGRTPQRLSPDTNERAATSILLEDTTVRGVLLANYLQSEEIQADPYFHRLNELTERSFLALQFMENEVDRRMEEVTRAELEQTYEKNKERFIEKEAYKLHRITVADAQPGPNGEDPGQMAAQKLREALEGVKTLEEFSEVAKSVGSDSTSRRGGAMGLVVAEKIEDADHKAIRKVIIPGVSEPVVRGNIAVAYFVEDRRPETVYTLDQREKDVRDVHHRELEGRVREEMLEKYAANVKVEVLD